MKYFSFWGFALLVVLVACQSKPKAPDGAVVIEAFMDNAFPEDLYDVEIDVIPLETSADAIMDQIQLILYKNGKFYFKSIRGTTIYIFDRTGKFLHRFDHNGKGPGEYIQVNDFQVDNNGRIIVLNLDDVKIYDSTYRFVEERSNCMFEGFYPIQFYLDSLGNMYAWNISYMTRNPDNIDRLFTFDSECKLIESRIRLPHQDPFAQRFYDYGGTVLVEPSKLDYDIFEIVDGHIRTKYTIDFGPHSIPEKYHSQHIEHKSDPDLMERIGGSGGFYYVSYPIESKDFFVFEATRLQQLYSFLYDKQLKNCYCMPYDKQDPFKFILARGYMDDRFFGLVEAPHFLNRLENIDPEKKEEILAKLGGCKIDETSNPIVVTWKISRRK